MWGGYVGRVGNLRRIGNPPAALGARPPTRAGSLPHRAGGLTIRRGSIYILVGPSETEIGFCRLSPGPP
jgi:hypothetical protein